eukprot:GILJ01010307.1.p1 GENE.GILJ01010307.1~~GILJ01010307.1.p1  ORF type:complete len:1489 (-),score=265.77 GILJ01010307.1:433-4305(-)
MVHCIENAPSSNAVHESLTHLVATAFDVMLTQWVNSRETKVRVETVHTLGLMTAVMPRDHLSNAVTALIPLILAQYRREKESEHLGITQGLVAVLTVATKQQPSLLEAHLPTMLNLLHPLLCVPVTYEEPNIAKNHNEMLRCLEILGRTFTDPVLTFLLTKLDSKISGERVGTLIIFRHFVNSLGEVMRNKKELLLSGVQPVVHEQDLPSRSALSELVIAMASQEYLSLEGGQTLVMFIVQQCAIPDTDVHKFDQQNKNRKVLMTPGSLRARCDQVLGHMTQTIPFTEQVLWPFLFEMIVPLKYTDALAVVCKCLTHLANKKKETGSLKLDFAREVNLPRPQQILCRLLYMAHEPFRRGQLGVRIIELIQAISPLLHPELGVLWHEGGNGISDAILYLTEGDFEGKVWEEKLLSLLKTALTVIPHEDWIVDFCDVVQSQFSNYSGVSRSKRILFRLLGIGLQRVKRKEYIRAKLDESFSIVDHNNDEEREGVAMEFGFVSNTHLDSTLDKLTVVLKSDPIPKKSSGFSLFSSKSTGGSEQAKSTVILAFGYVALHATPSLIVSRVEAHILTNIVPLLSEAKSLTLKECLVRASGLIGIALHPKRLGIDYQLNQRDELVNHLLTYLTPDKAHAPPPTFQNLILEALSSLCLLMPPLSDRLLSQLLSSCLPLIAEPEEPVSRLIPLFTLLQSLLTADSSWSRLSTLIGHIYSYPSAQVAVRSRAIQCCSALFVKPLPVNVKDKSDWAACAANILPRIFDSSSDVRRIAIQIFELMVTWWLNSVRDQVRHESGPDSSGAGTSAEEAEKWKLLRQRLDSSDKLIRAAVVKDIVTLLSALLDPTVLPALLEPLTCALNDSDVDSAVGSADLLTFLIQDHVENLAESVPLQLHALLGLDDKTLSEEAANSRLSCIRILANQHFVGVMQELLDTGLPFQPAVKQSFQKLAKDRSILLKMMNHLTDIMNNSDPGDAEMPNPTVMAATAALGEIFKVSDPQLQGIVRKYFSQLVCTLWLRLGTANTIGAKDVAAQAARALRELCMLAQEEELILAMESKGLQQKLVGNLYDEGVAELAQLFFRIHADAAPSVFKFMQPFLTRNYDGQRVSATAVCSQLLTYCSDDASLLSQIISCLLARATDKCELVRKQSLRGLGQLSTIWQQVDTNEWAMSVIHALVTSMDDPAEAPARESVSSLARFVDLLDDKLIAASLVNICFRLRPALDRDDPAIRGAAVDLFGRLCRFGKGAAGNNFQEQVHINLPSIVLHLNDAHVSVQEACDRCLAKMAVYSSQNRCSNC